MVLSHDSCESSHPHLLGILPDLGWQWCCHKIQVNPAVSLVGDITRFSLTMVLSQDSDVSVHSHLLGILSDLV